MTNSHKPSPASPLRRELIGEMEPLNRTQSGALFYLDDGREMFQYRADANSIVGPRVANESDKTDHAGEYARFKASLPQPAEPDEPQPSANDEPEPVQQPRKPGRPRKSE